MLIPDLQRPYVWTPNQVTLLIDSLIRGWPFGTLLLWKVNHQELEGIPFRPFWTVVKRTGEQNGAQVLQMNPPAEYHMVLDGQQRVQSLLLALGGDDWGFILEDREWNEEIKERRSRGRQAKFRHWSKASLCFDLQRFRDEYSNQGGNLLAVDFQKVLTWAVTDPQGGQSSYPKPENYEDPLPNAHAPQNQGRLVRLSRLWKEAQANPSLKEAQFRAIITPLLVQHGLKEPHIKELLQPLGELMTTLRDVKLADVTYLELQPYDEHTWTRDAYNDAIVSIFTRLNTAGRTLTREEITLAWLKVGWQTELTGDKSAGECFTDLQGLLADQNLPLETDELVSAASFVWAVADNAGHLLANSDLLKGAVIRPMAAALSKEWHVVLSAFALGAKALNQRMIEYGQRGQFSSLYALAVLWAWIYIGESWKDSQSLGEMARDDFEKRSKDSVSRYLDRWIMCSQWAGVWSSASITTIEAYAKALTEARNAMALVSDHQTAHQMWDACFAKFLDNLVNDATTHINTVSAPSRERVAVFRSPLWVWHRLEAARWATSQVQLRVGKSKPSAEVDHTIAFNLWQNKVLSTPGIDTEEALSLANRLGNCALLEKNFNISKSDKSLKSFLGQIHEVVQHKIRIDAWCAALSISQPMLDPGTATVEEITNAIESRDKEIRADLVDFIRGQQSRVDVSVPLPVNVVHAVQVQAAAASHSAVQVQAAAASHSAAIDPAPPSETSPTPLPDEGTEREVEDDETATLSSVADLASLSVAYKEDSNVRLILDHFANRQRNRTVTELEAFIEILGRAGTPLEKPALIHAFRRLDALGIGRFVTGRRGHATRFEWREKSLAVRDLALSGRRE